jgi:hypothetical protein
MATVLQHLSSTNARVEGLRAEFAGLEKVNNIINDVLKRLQARSDVQTAWSTMSIKNFDGWFEPLVRAELGKVLGIMRARAVQKAQTQGKAGSASYAVLRRMYKDELGGNINIADNRGRISSRRRMYEPGKIKPRHVSKRTRDLNEYYGPDRSFILRFLEGGTDVRTAKTFGPTGRGSTASWGARGNIAPRSFFHNMSSDMEQAAQQLGYTLAGHVEKWLEQQFTEENK